MFYNLPIVLKLQDDHSLMHMCEAVRGTVTGMLYELVYVAELLKFINSFVGFNSVFDTWILTQTPGPRPDIYQ